jgi:hypothetical protein
VTIYFSLSYTTQSEIAVPLNGKYLAPKKETKKAQLADMNYKEKLKMQWKNQYQ